MDVADSPTHAAFRCEFGDSLKANLSIDLNAEERRTCRKHFRQQNA